MTDHEILAATLHDHGRTERLAVGRFTYLLKSERLLPEERAWIKRTIAQELEHSRRTQEFADKYAPFREDRVEVGPAYQEYQDQIRHRERPENMAVYMYLAERYAMYVFRNLEKLFVKTGDQEALALYRWIMDEEAEHVRGGGKIVRRLFKDPEIGGELRAFYRKTLRDHYRKHDFQNAHRAEIRGLQEIQS